MKLSKKHLSILAISSILMAPLGLIYAIILDQVYGISTKDMTDIIVHSIAVAGLGVIMFMAPESFIDIDT